MSNSSEIASIIAEARSVAKERGTTSELELAHTVAYLTRGVSSGMIRHAAAMSETEFGSGKSKAAL